MPLPAVITQGPGTLYVTTANMTTTAATIWQDWNQFYTTTGSTITGVTWNTWNAAWTETAEQAAARQARERQAAEQYAEQARQQARQLEAARERAEELLTALLTGEQAASRRESGWFAVRGSSSGKTYRIHSTGISNNVDRLGEDGRRERIFCAHPPGLPAPDVHLAQMLALATDEDAFLRVANSHVPSERRRLAAVPAA